MLCSYCQHENGEGARFCEQCGTKLARVCTACGHPVGAEARFCAGCGAALGVAPAAAPVPLAPVPSAAVAAHPSRSAEDDGGERRQLTVLFSDLVGSTEISAGMDPEDWRELVRRYQQTAAAAVEQFGGHVAQYLGDGVLVYFGWPHAHEDDAYRAVSAALAIVEEMFASSAGRDSATAPLRVRVGIHTGPVVVGRGGGGALAFGETTNLAARVQAAAAPDTVFISAVTHRLVSGLFVVEERGAHALKGIPEPVVLYRVVQASGVRGRLHALAARDLTPFVGRESELRTLHDRWEQVREGDGQMVLVSGEAGIGKSRLVQQFREVVRGEPHTWLETAASPYCQNAPLYPVSEIIEQALGQGGRASVGERAARLEMALAASGMDVGEATALIAPLLGITLPNDPPSMASPEQQRRKLLAILVEWTFAAARMQPTILVGEDIHWVDPSTLELLHLMAEQCARVPMLLILTARPELKLPWPLRAHHTQLTLSRLSRRHVQSMIASLAAQAAVDSELAEAVAARTDGVPLYIEELTKAVLEARSTVVEAEAIPSTLQDSLMARLDRVGEAKELAQIGAVIGREFSYGLAETVSGLPSGDLQARLQTLIDAELVYERGMRPDSTYLFKHALVQEAAYRSLLKSRRRELHRAVAKALTAQFAETIEAHPDIVAEHWTAADETERAVAAWRQAAERAKQRSALAESAAHYRRAIALIQIRPDTPARAEEELLLQVALADVLYFGPSSGEKEQALERARELGQKVDNLQSLFFVLLGLWSSALCRAEVHAARDLADQLGVVAEREALPALLAWAEYARGQTLYNEGLPAAALPHYEGSFAHYREDDHRLVPLDPRFLSLCLGAILLTQLGSPDQARQWLAEAEALAERLQNPLAKALVLSDVASVGALLGEATAVVEPAARLRQIGREQNFLLYDGLSGVFGGWAAGMLGRHEPGITELRQGMADYVAAGQRSALGCYLGLLAEVQLSAGAIADGLRTIDEALAAAPGELIHVPGIVQVRGELLAAHGDTAGAEASYREAIELAGRMGAKLPELRAASSLARLLESQGRGSDAVGLLEPLYAAFSEGFDREPLRSAKSLLDRLNEGAARSSRDAAVPLS